MEVTLKDRASHSLLYMEHNIATQRWYGSTPGTTWKTVAMSLQDFI